MAPPGHCDGVSTGSTATTRAHCAARACLAALQGGQAGAHPKARPSKTKPATKQRLDQSRIKTATSPANSSGSGPAFTTRRQPLEKSFDAPSDPLLGFDLQLFCERFQWVAT